MAAEILPHDEDVEPVAPEARRLGSLQIGVLWGDLSVGLLVLVAGSLLVPALGLRDAIIATVIGSVIGSALLAVAGCVGTDTGVPTMVALRPSLGIRGSYLASAMNIMQLIGWAGLEMLIMAQAARALSDEFFGFDGYYLWLALFALLATAFAIGGPVVVVRDFLQRFGVWIVLAATAWLTYRLFVTYDVHQLFDDSGTGGFPGFWQGVDIAVSLPVSWLPLVADYSRHARHRTGAAWATFASYSIGNTWFFALGAGYALALSAGPLTLIDALVGSMLGLAVGWLFLFAILADETDNAFANVYSTAISMQNIVRLPHAALAVAIGLAASLLAASVDLLGYETFLLLIGGVFVSLFGVMIADYFLLRGRRYHTDQLFVREGSYWYTSGVNVAGLLAWFAGFWTFVVCGQPPWMLDHFPAVTDLAGRIEDALGLDVTAVGGTIPSFAVSLVLYLALARALQPFERLRPVDLAPAKA